MVFTCMQKISLGRRVCSGAVAFQTPQKSIKQPKWGAARPLLGLYVLEFVKNFKEFQFLVAVSTPESASELRFFGPC